MIKELGPGFRLTLFFTVLTGLLYPAMTTGISQLVFPDKSNGSLITVDGKVVGSELIGQPFSKPEYFHPRPSAAGGGYDATASGGSNLGPTSAKLIHGIHLRIVQYTIENEIPYDSSVPLDQFKDADGNLDGVKLMKAFADEKAPLVFTPRTPVPADAVTASASGLDPHISPANAEAQAARIARARKVSLDQVKQAIAESTRGADLGFLGEPRVNVVTLNVALDQRFPILK